ncbi:hypothetical protein B0H11DRAFT_2414783 [Mycena galericulata]|nr:hypothetical protein B0H11DRAFT_2414783 [Mycena galericulata]
MHSWLSNTRLTLLAVLLSSIHFTSGRIVGGGGGGGSGPPPGPCTPLDPCPVLPGLTAASPVTFSDSDIYCTYSDQYSKCEYVSNPSAVFAGSQYRVPQPLPASVRRTVALLATHLLQAQMDASRQPHAELVNTPSTTFAPTAPRIRIPPPDFHAQLARAPPLLPLVQVAHQPARNTARPANISLEILVPPAQLEPTAVQMLPRAANAPRIPSLEREPVDAPLAIAVRRPILYSAPLSSPATTNDRLQGSSTCTTPGPTPSHAPRAWAERGVLTCPLQGYMRCPVMSGSNRLECIDIKNSLESCGGCVESTNPQSSGQDCSAIEHADTVRCSNGRCLVLKCRTNYEVSISRDSCVEVAQSSSSSSRKLV